MRDYRCFIDSNILIKNQELILLPGGVFLWNKIVLFLQEKFNMLGYKQIYVDNLLAFVEKNNEYPTQYFTLKNDEDKIKLISYGKYLNEIEEARNKTIDILEIYNLLGKDLLAIPFLMGKLPLEQDKNILSTYLGKKDVEASYLGKKKEYYLNYSCITTDILFTLLNIHRDEKGLVLPPRIAPNQIAIVPLKQNEKGVLKECREVLENLKRKGFRVVLNDSNKITSNEKRTSFIEAGIPLIIEIGPRDVERKMIEVISRDNLEKIEILNDDKLVEQINYLLQKMHKRMYNKILINSIKKEKSIVDINSLLIKENEVNKVSWCGEEECLKNYKSHMNFISFNQQQKEDKCLFCSRKSKYVISMIKN